MQGLFSLWGFGVLFFFEKFWVHSKIETSADFLFSCPLLSPSPASPTGVVHLLLMELYWHLLVGTQAELTLSPLLVENSLSLDQQRAIQVPIVCLAASLHSPGNLMCSSCSLLSSTWQHQSFVIHTAFFFPECHSQCLRVVCIFSWLLLLKFRVGVTCVFWGTPWIIGF